MRFIIREASKVATNAPKKYIEVSTPKYLSENPSSMPRKINSVVSKLLPSSNKKIATNNAMMESKIERMVNAVFPLCENAKACLSLLSELCSQYRLGERGASTQVQWIFVVYIPHRLLQNYTATINTPKRLEHEYSWNLYPAYPFYKGEGIHEKVKWAKNHGWENFCQNGLLLF